MSEAGHDREAAVRMQLLVACARRAMSSAQRAQLRELAGRPGLDWDALLAEAGRHGLLPLLAHHLRASGIAGPAGFAASMWAVEVRTAKHTLAATGALLALLKELRATGITAVPYKGPVLSLQLYGSAALRLSGDLDLLVSRADVTGAHAVLAASGYTAQHVQGDAGLDFRLRNYYSEEFSHPVHAPVELHWAFTLQDIGLPLDLEQLRPRLGSIRLDGADVPVFGSEDLLIILSVHGAKHRWERLEWLAGLAEAVRQAPAVDWVTLTGRAASLGVLRMLLLGLLLAHDLLDAPVPGHVVDQARRDGNVAQLAVEVPAILLAPVWEQSELSLPVDRFRYSLRERWRDRLRFVLYRITTPSRPKDWRYITIGGMRVPVHGVIRPFQLAVQVVSVLLRKVGGRAAR